MGYPPSEARSSLRLSLGRTTTDADIDLVAEMLPRIIGRLREGQARLAGGGDGIAEAAVTRGGLGSSTAGAAHP